MQSEFRKYQFFPREKAAVGRSLDPEEAFAMVMGQNGDGTDKSSVSNALKLRIRQHNVNRRKKIGLPDLGPMTTVHEAAMDSPTIPGRPALRERSASAPLKQNHLVECMTPPVIEEEGSMESGKMPSSESLKIKQLAPPEMLAPTMTSSPLKRQIHSKHLRSGSTPISSNRTRPDGSPAGSLRTLFTPLSTTAIPPRSAAASATPSVTVSTVSTLISAPVESRSSPKLVDRDTATGSRTPDSMAMARPELEPRSARPAGSSNSSHHRQESETGSIVDRGRSRKKTENSNGPLLKRNKSKRCSSKERRAFEQLPKGWKGCEAITMLKPTEVTAIQQQALGQASRFEVLRKEDVDSLSRELRHLDERTDYLRRTYASLRAGRRNLHARVCQHLKPPRAANFNLEAVLKQEQALSELDNCIDDWVNKLDYAENRRTRVRQKLLEHVAAATILPLTSSPGVGVSHTLPLTVGIPSPASNMCLGNISTPPRSPTKESLEQRSQSNSPSPQRVVPCVPSTILEQPRVEENASASIGRGPQDKRADVESIRIYADSEIYALLQDVENEISNMGGGSDYTAPPSSHVAMETKALQCRTGELTEDEHKELQRAQSHEKLSGLTSKYSSPSTTPTTANSNSIYQSSSLSLPTSPPAPLPPLKDTLAQDGIPVLTSAVFKPEGVIVAA